MCFSANFTLVYYLWVTIQHTRMELITGVSSTSTVLTCLADTDKHTSLLQRTTYFQIRAEKSLTVKSNMLYNNFVVNLVTFLKLGHFWAKVKTLTIEKWSSLPKISKFKQIFYKLIIKKFWNSLSHYFCRLHHFTVAKKIFPFVKRCSLMQRMSEISPKKVYRMGFLYHRWLHAIVMTMFFGWQIFSANCLKK